MKILILGSGATGSVTAKKLADFPNVEKIILGDISEKKPKNF